MKQVVQRYKDGVLEVFDVPPPVITAGRVLIANRFSLISAGTERAKVELAQKNLLAKVRSRPDQVRLVWQKIRQEGFRATYQKVKQRLEAYSPLGYSCAGEVVGVGEGVSSLRVGDRVSAAGAEYAYHAEVVSVPENLVAPVPESVSLDRAAFATLGAIALQGIRQAGISLGERVVVIGLGLLGQLTLPILRACGVSVLGIDLSADKVVLARRLGFPAYLRFADDIRRTIEEFSNGWGADAVIITAATASNDPLVLAGEIARDRGRVVVVGAVKLDFPREQYYAKELSLYLSRSYGPGRYDKIYEEAGLDYPIGYVRWTEQRNLSAFLNLLAEGKIDLSPLITHRFPLESARQAYELIQKDEEFFLGILLEYPTPSSQNLGKRISFPEATRPLSAEKVNLGVIGAGNFALGILLPALLTNPRVEPVGVATQTGTKARYVAERFHFRYATSDYQEVLADPAINLLLVATRHNLHTPLVKEALSRQKAIYVEKPLALNPGELDDLLQTYNQHPGWVMVGFNRRFAPLVRRLQELLNGFSGPAQLFYRINAGYLPPEHWLHNPQEGGGRIVGEICHFVDLLQFLTGSVVINVQSAALRSARKENTDDVSVNLELSDGSVATLLYTAQGDPASGKERLEIFRSQATFILDDFRELLFFSRTKKKQWRTGIDKGHKSEMSHLVSCFLAGQPSPVPFSEAVAVTRVTFAIQEAIKTGSSVKIV